MKEIVDRILSEEETARKNIEEAQIQSADIIANANREASVFIEDTITSVKDFVKRKKEEYENQFLMERERILKEAKEHASALRNSRTKDIDSIAERIFSELITTQE